MSSEIYTQLWLAPADFKKRKVRKFLEDYWSFEYDDDNEDRPDDEGTVRLIANEHESYGDLQTLANMGVPFLARIDGRAALESQMLFLAYRKKTIYIQESGEGQPVVRVFEDGKVHVGDLKAARAFWKMTVKVRRAWLQKLAAMGIITEPAVQA